jgi:acetoacetyl-CoA synthetase
VRVVLFVVLADRVQLNATLEREIRDAIRERTTPRHVPAVILAVSDIPRTRSGKIAELAVKRVINNEPPGNTAGLANPEVLALFQNLPALQA